MGGGWAIATGKRMKVEKWVVLAWRPLFEAEFLPMVLKITFQ